jgi:hypothetical protein
VSHERKISAFAAAVLLSRFSSLMEARAQTAAPKSSIYDQPPKPEKPAMTPDERLKLLKDLTAARDRQTPKAKVRRPKLFDRRSIKCEAESSGPASHCATLFVQERLSHAVGIIRVSRKNALRKSKIVVTISIIASPPAGRPQRWGNALGPWGWCGAVLGGAKRAPH